MHNYKNEKYENIETYKLQSAQPVQIGWRLTVAGGGSQKLFNPWSTLLDS